MASAGCSVDTAAEEAAASEQTGSTEQASLFAVYTGFVWADKTSGSYDAPADFSDGAYDDPIRVSWLGTGRARVDFPHLDKTSGGNVQVTAYGDGNARCKVERWSSATVADALSVFVRCHTPSGALASSPFVAAFGDQRGATYAWANQESATSYTPSSSYSSGVTKITRSGEGRYILTMAGQDRVGGNVQVTAYGTNSNYCDVQAWAVEDGDTKAWVRCYDTAGHLADSQFSFRYTTTPGTFYPYLESYTWANDDTDSSYTPNKRYQEFVDCYQEGGPLNCSHSTDNLAGRTSKGHYWVSYPGVTFRPSAALVTAYGVESKYCKVKEWRIDGARVKVSVNCFDDNGEPADTQFSQMLLSQQDF
jgi:hypothetical protein